VYTGGTCPRTVSVSELIWACSVSESSGLLYWFGLINRKGSELASESSFSAWFCLHICFGSSNFACNILCHLFSFQLSVGDTQHQDKLWNTTGYHKHERQRFT